MSGKLLSNSIFVKNQAKQLELKNAKTFWQCDYFDYYTCTDIVIIIIIMAKKKEVNLQVLCYNWHTNILIFKV